MFYSIHPCNLQQSRQPASKRESTLGQGIPFELILPTCLCVPKCTYLRTLRFVEGWAAEGVGDERGPRQGICAVELHAV